LITKRELSCVVSIIKLETYVSPMSTYYAAVRLELTLSLTLAVGLKIGIPVTPAL